MEHLLDGALARAAAVFGLALVAASACWRAATGEERPAGDLRRVGGALLVGAVVLQLVAIVAVVEGPLSRTIPTVLTGTAYGASLAVFAAFAAAAWLGGRWAWIPAAGAAWGLARLGHAAGEGTWSAAVLVTTLHIAAAGVWLGGLALAVGAGPAATRRFGRVALGCVVVLVATGGLRATTLIGAGWARLAAGDLEGASWLGALGMKLVVVGVALGFAVRVRRSVRAGRPAGLGAELVAVGLAVLLAALLARLPTP